MQGSCSGGQSLGHLLVVDDDCIIQMVLTEMLGELGYDVTVADDGQSAIDRLAQTQFDLVLMDCQMPNMDGLTAVRNIRANEDGTYNARIPIIALSAFNSKDEIAAFMTAGVDAHVSKPIDAQVLTSAIGAHLQGGTGPEAASRPKNTRSGNRGATESVTEFIDRIVSRFMEEVPGFITSLEGAVVKPDIGQLLEIGHTLRGSASIIGASAVMKLAAELESAAKLGDQPTCETRAGRLIEELKKLSPPLDELE